MIDTHQHLILRETIGYAWVGNVPALAGRDFTQADYAALAPHISGTVFMETGVDDDDYKTEARLVSRLIGSHGMLAQVASCRPEEYNLTPWLDECAGLGVHGFRRILHEAPDDLSRSDLFRANLRLIGARGLPFDLCLLARQLGIGEELLHACPDQVFVLDHCGNPDVAKDQFAAWSKGLARLAQFENLTIKLSGITRNARPDQRNAESLRPYFDRMLELFGPSRMVWASDWPVVDLGAGLPAWLTITDELLRDLSADERAQITEKTARRVYNLPN